MSEPFSSNCIRLSGVQWLIVLSIVAGFAIGAPAWWKQSDRGAFGPDYRLPYALSKDYWLYERHLEHCAHQISDPIFVVGDSVVWGEYVSASGTLSHFLNDRSGDPARFVNAGINGLFPLALEGLIESYGGPLKNRKVLLHCNLLWMSSREADLNVAKETKFNHESLVPQFAVKIPCYKADLSERLDITVERSSPFLSWLGHLQTACFEGKSIPDWTLENDGRFPPGYPNTYANPLNRITLQSPGERSDDPDRGRHSSRHKAWTESGRKPQRFEWVRLDDSLQWAAFQRLSEHLKSRGNDVLVVIGPFNSHMIAAGNQVEFLALRLRCESWFDANGLPHIVPTTLPSHLYGDASHPLTEGYEVLAAELGQDAVFSEWAQ